MPAIMHKFDEREKGLCVCGGEAHEHAIVEHAYQGGGGPCGALVPAGKGYTEVCGYARDQHLDQATTTYVDPLGAEQIVEAWLLAQGDNEVDDEGTTLRDYLECFPEIRDDLQGRIARALGARAVGGNRA